MEVFFKFYGKLGSYLGYFASIELSVSEKNALALPILKRASSKNKRVINILANLQAYFNNRCYFPILMLKFG